MALYGQEKVVPAARTASLHHEWVRATFLACSSTRSSITTILVRCRVVYTAPPLYSLSPPSEIFLPFASPSLRTRSGQDVNSCALCRCFGRAAATFARHCPAKREQKGVVEDNLRRLLYLPLCAMSRRYSPLGCGLIVHCALISPSFSASQAVVYFHPPSLPSPLLDARLPVSLAFFFVWMVTHMSSAARAV